MVYLFSRNKQTGNKRVLREDLTVEDARKICTKHNNNPNNKEWFEFTDDVEYTK